MNAGVDHAITRAPPPLPVDNDASSERNAPWGAVEMQAFSFPRSPRTFCWKKSGFGLSGKTNSAPIRLALDLLRSRAMVDQ